MESKRSSIERPSRGIEGSRAAAGARRELLGISPSTLDSRIRKLGYGGGENGVGRG